MDLIVYIITSFIFYSFIGWVIEMLYHFCIHRNFKKPGFLKGPYKPMYGIAVTVLILCRDIFDFNIIEMIILCFIIPSVIEYISGYILKKVFKEVYWDYSDLRYNISGFVTLSFSIYWCVLSLLGIYIVHPLLYKYILMNFYGEINILTCIAMSIFLWDLFSKLSLKVIRRYAG